MRVKLISTATQEPYLAPGLQLFREVPFAFVEGKCIVANADRALSLFRLQDGTTMEIGSVPATFNGPDFAVGDRVGVWVTAKYTLSYYRKNGVKSSCAFWCEELENISRGKTHDVGFWVCFYSKPPTVWDRLLDAV